MDMKSNDNGYEFELLHEQVSSNDVFPDQTHKRVADTLFRLVDSSDKAFTVGLEGGWGSGKSTVVELFKNKLRDDGNGKTLFFVFDAWAHEGDPLRRIFLESLIDEIDPSNEDEYLTALLDEIGGRSKSVVVTTTRKASSLGRKLFLSALMVPIGSALLSLFKYNDLAFSVSKIGSDEILFLIGLLLIGGPLIFLAYWWLCGEKGKDGTVRWDFMESDSTEDYTQDITEDGERTSIEFERYFKSVFEYVFDNKEGNKIIRSVIVIDNLDRIDTDHAARIWSTLQTFFQHRNCNNKQDEWVKKLWFIVPYDREGLSRIWGSKFEVSDEYSEQNILIKNNQPKKIIPEISKSFLNKNFQVIAEVPSPVMSAWQEFCHDCVYKALDKWPEDEKDVVISTFQRYASRLDISPTPREIQNFVNQVGLMGMTWGGNMAAESIALYVLLRQSRSENELRKDLLLSGLPDKYESYADKGEIKKELAGMLFGVPKEKGVQLLLGPEIHDAMREGNGKILETLLSEQGEAFWIAWQAIKEEIAVSTSHTQEYIVSVTHAMHEGLLSVRDKIKPEISELEKVWQATSEKWDFKKFAYDEVVPLMSDLVESKEIFVTWVHNTIKQKLNILINHDEKDEIDRDALHQLSSLSLFLVENNKPLDRCRYGVLTRDGWSRWLAVLEDEKINMPPVLPAKGAINAIAEELLPSPTTTDDNIVKILLDTIKLYPDCSEWESVAEIIVQWANHPSRELEKDNVYELMINIYNQCGSKISKIIKDCVEGDDVWVRGASEELDANQYLPLLAASVLGKKLQSSKNISSNIQEFWTDDSTSEQVLKLLDELNLFSIVWQMARDENNLLAISIVRKNVNNKKLYLNKNVLLYLRDFSWVVKNDERVVFNLCESNGLEEAIDEIKGDVSYYDHNLYLLKLYGNQEAKNIVSVILESMSKEQWEESFKENKFTLYCIEAEDVKLTHKFKDAFNKTVLDAIEGSFSGDWLWKRFDVFIDKTIDKDIFLHNICNKYFLIEDDKLNDFAFDSLSVFIQDYVKKIDSMIVMARLYLWVDQEKWQRVQWVVDSGYVMDREPTESLSSIVNTVLREIEDELTTKLLHKLADVFSIKIIHDEKNNQVDSEI